MTEQQARLFNRLDAMKVNSTATFYGVSVYKQSEELFILADVQRVCFYEVCQTLLQLAE